jgi:hypothetical protein
VRYNLLVPTRVTDSNTSRQGNTLILSAVTAESDSDDSDDSESETEAVSSSAHTHATETTTSNAGGDAFEDDEVKAQRAKQREVEYGPRGFPGADAQALRQRLGTAPAAPAARHVAVARPPHIQQSRLALPILKEEYNVST